MAADIWTAQLHIVEGQVSEDAPEIAYAERPGGEGRPARLYMLAEPARPGSEEFIGDLVNLVGEDFQQGEGSLTGILQRALTQRHEELLDHNRTSLPSNQASYGLSCLIVRDEQAFLAQIGPSLAYYRQGGRLLRRRPASDRAATPLGSSEPIAPEFSRIELEPGDWALLISSSAAAAIAEEAIAPLRDLAAEDVLPALFPLLRPLPRVSALVVAAIAEAEPPARQQASATPVEPVAAAADAPPVRAAAAPARGSEAAGRAESPEVAATAAAEPTPGEIAAASGETAAAAEYPRRTPVTVALGDAWRAATAAVARLWRRERRPNVWDDPALRGDEAAPTGDAETPEPAVVEAGAATVDSAAPREREGAEPESAVGKAAAETAAGEDASAASTPADASSAGDGHDDDGPNEDGPNEDGPEAGDEPPGGPPSSSGASGPEGESDDAEAAGGERRTGERGTVEFSFIASDPALEALEPQAAGWPSNPFSPQAPPVLRTAVDVDASRVARPLFGLRSYIPSFRRRGFRAQRAAEAREDAGPGWRGSWGPIVLGLGAMLTILAIVAGALLVPELLQDSERSRFDQLLNEGRRGLTTATLTTDPSASRQVLTDAAAAVEEALELRPLDPAALSLELEVSAALRQASAIVRPADLTLVQDFSERVAPPLALASVQIGGETAYVLDESGGRIFAVPLAGGEPEVIFQAGESYRLIFQFRGPEAAGPVSMQWSEDRLGVSLTILDANGRLFRYTAAGGVEALELPNAQLLGSADAVAVADGAVYVLDVAGGGIWRFPLLNDGGLGPGVLAIGRSDLTTAASLLVDEWLFVAGTDGRIRRFDESGELGFPLLDLDRPLLVPASLAVGEISRLIYAVDRGNNRVVVFTPSGELVAQLRDNQLSGLRGVGVDEAKRRLYYVTADALLTSALPEFVDR